MLPFSSAPDSFDIPVIDSFDVFSNQIDSFIDPLFLNAHHLPPSITKYIHRPQFRQFFKLQVAFYLFSLAPSLDPSARLENNHEAIGRLDGGLNDPVNFLKPDLSFISRAFVHAAIAYAHERHLFETGSPLCLSKL
jgi:hypothetical protein